MHSVTRRDFLGVSGAAMLGRTLPHRTATEEIHQPCQSKQARTNLILFMPDELRADALACYGNPLTKTPNFDRLAAQGTRFANCHVQYPLCGPSRCSLLTGWPVSVRGHRSNEYFLRPDEPNLFRYLRRAGYDVFWYGKNDVLVTAFTLALRNGTIPKGGNLLWAGGEENLCIRVRPRSSAARELIREKTPSSHWFS